MSATIEGWLGLTNGETPLAHPRASARYASALIGLVVIGGFLVPDGPLAIDTRWSELMRDADAAWWTHLALVFNALGHGILRGLTIAGVGLVLLIAGRRAALLAFALAEALTPLLVNLIKLLVGRERPPGAMIEAHGSSYPSGHAAYAGATAVVLVLLFTTQGRLRRIGWATAVVSTAGMVWSRTYLQVHWLTDAAAGATLGIGVALLSVAAVQIISTRVQQRDISRPDKPRELVADGNHARVDGFVSLGVIASALLVGLGLPRADPLVGLAITLVILKITWDSWKTIRATEPGEPL